MRELQHQVDTEGIFNNTGWCNNDEQIKPPPRRTTPRRAETYGSLYLALVVLQLSVAVEEAGLLDLWESLALIQVAEPPSVELTLSLACLLVHLGHDTVDELQLGGTKGWDTVKRHSVLKWKVCVWSEQTSHYLWQITISLSESQKTVSSRCHEEVTMCQELQILKINIGCRQMDSTIWRNNSGYTTLL